MELIIARPSPFARKVRVALHEKGIPFTERMDVPWSPDTATVEHNPLGKVPVLIEDDGRVFHDSSVILEYIETLGHDPALYPADPAARVAARQIETLAGGICDAVVLTVLEESRKPELQSADWRGRQMRKIAAGTAALERAVDGRAWFVGDAMTVADIAAGCAAAYMDLRRPDFAWRGGHPALAAFSDRMEARPSFAATRPEVQEIAPVT